MRLDLLPTGGWEKANGMARETFTSSPENEIRCYHGMVAGLLEVFNGTASFLSHKRTLALVTGQSWAQEAVLPQLLRENFQIKSFAAESLQNPQAVLEQLDAETSCFVWPEDHPLTGQVFESPDLTEGLMKKRIFSIRLSHHAFRTRPKIVGPYEVRLCSVSPRLSVAVCGSRFRTPVMTAAFEAWDSVQVQSDLKKAFEDASEDSARVQNFESSLNRGWQPLLKTSERLWDRTVIFNTSASGDEALLELSKALSRPLQPAGEKTWAESLHLCRWGSTMQEIGWWKNHPSPEQIRGSLILDASLLEQETIVRLFKG